MGRAVRWIPRPAPHPWQADPPRPRSLQVAHVYDPSLFFKERFLSINAKCNTKSNINLDIRKNNIVFKKINIIRVHEIVSEKQISSNL